MAGSTIATKLVRLRKGVYGDSKGESYHPRVASGYQWREDEGLFCRIQSSGRCHCKNYQSASKACPGKNAAPPPNQAADVLKSPRRGVEISGEEGTGETKHSLQQEVPQNQQYQERLEPEKNSKRCLSSQNGCNKKKSSGNNDCTNNRRKQ